MTLDGAKIFAPLSKEELGSSSFFIYDLILTPYIRFSHIWDSIPNSREKHRNGLRQVGLA
jgi:hypothetical protein